MLGKTVGAIGYVEVAYSLTNHLEFAAVANRAGAYTLPGLRSIAAAAATIKSVPRGNAMSIVDPPATQRLAYPIATFTYVIVPLHTAKAVALRHFVFWALTAGQRLGTSLFFAPIPKPVLVAAEKAIDLIAA